MPYLQRLEGRRGLSLAELLIAMLVGAIAILMVALLISSVWRAASEGKYQAAASNVARGYVEQLRGDANFLQTCMATNPQPTQMSTQQRVDGAQDTRFDCEIRIQPLANSNNAFQDVSVKVSWPQEHRTRSVTLQTYLPTP